MLSKFPLFIRFSLIILFSFIIFVFTFNLKAIKAIKAIKSVNKIGINNFIKNFVFFFMTLIFHMFRFYFECYFFIRVYY